MDGVNWSKVSPRSLAVFVAPQVCIKGSFESGDGTDFGPGLSIEYVTQGRVTDSGVLCYGVDCPGCGGDFVSESHHKVGDEVDFRGRVVVVRPVRPCDRVSQMLDGFFAFGVFGGHAPHDS